jgi:branched-chain amino acid transport system permease protein
MMPSFPLRAKGLEAPDYTVQRWTRMSIFGTSGLGVVVAVLALLPFMVGLSVTYAMVDFFILLLLAMTWNLLAGYGGMVSVGQQAYIGIGAYAVVVFADTFNLNIVVTILLAAIVSAILAFPISFFAFRLVGGYFAIGTWVLAEVVRLIVVQFPQIGGGAGISLAAMNDIPKDLRIAISYWIALGAAVVVLVVCVWLVRSRIGLALTAVRDDVTAAATSGVRVQSVRRRVFIFAAAAAGVAGALVAISTMRVQPDSVFSVQWSAFMIFIVVVGGVGTLEGPIIGAIIFWVLKQLLADYGPLYLIFLGAVGIVFVLFVRGGVWGLVSRRKRLEIFPVGYRFSQPEKKTAK